MARGFVYLLWFALCGTLVSAQSWKIDQDCKTWLRYGQKKGRYARRGLEVNEYDQNEAFESGLDHYEETQAAELEEETHEITTDRNLARGSSSLLKLYHEPWSCWQYERKDRKWCMRKSGNQAKLTRCNQKDSSQQFQFVNLSKKGNTFVGQIRYGGSRRGQCLERVTSKRIQIRRCNRKNRRQFFSGLNRGKGAFEIHPNGDESQCLTNPHHPKSNEVLFVQRCNTARSRNHATHLWERY
eukprot:scaffold24884_cov54-Attheya_sp.AAC.7